MICEKILGKLTDDEFAGKKVDYVDFQWDEAFKKLHRKVSRGGVDVGVNMDDTVLTRGLLQDDVLAVEGDERCGGLSGVGPAVGGGMGACRRRGRRGVPPYGGMPVAPRGRCGGNGKMQPETPGRPVCREGVAPDDG